MNEKPLADAASNLPGIDGFLGTRGSFMLDVVFTAMFVVVPVMLYSIYLVRAKRNYGLHKKIQLTLGLVLLVTVSLFEADMRINGWEARAEPSPYLTIAADGSKSGLVQTVLWIHLFFAVTTFVLWTVVIIRAWRNFPSPVVPNDHSHWHRRWAKVAAVDLISTSVTGWTFYWLAFVAT
jgi:uncharacterized membrane protein YozB (DUF420 family)